MLITNATLATMEPDGHYGLVRDGAIHIDGNRIQWIGATRDLPGELRDQGDQLDLGGKLVTPGLVDCHTHLVYGADRAAEFELRLTGASYEEIARSGGGIVSTVEATRAASREALVEQSRPRLARLMSEGVTTVEIKSGYGLDRDNEIKMLEAAMDLAGETGVRLQKTFLGAHALPPEYHGRPDDYIELVCNTMLPAAHAAGVVDAVDAFAENIAFSVEQVAKVFDVALKAGLRIKLHAEQLSNLGGAKMAAQKGALSVDHIEYLEPADAVHLARSGTVAVLLPGAFYFLRETRLPPVDALRDNLVPIAIATDCNPGSSPLTSILLAMSMACTFFRLTPAEALRGVTINAARALGMHDSIGSLAQNKMADLVVWNTDNPAALAYNVGLNPCERVMIDGQWQEHTKT
jgi:imidazolonepropionase